MKWIHLGYEYFACVSNDDYERVSQYVWRSSKAGYGRTHQITMNGDDTFLHDFVCLEKGEQQEIDHINRAKWDNRKENLRVVERWQNQQNKGMPLNAPYPSIEEMAEAVKQRISMKKSQSFLSCAAKRNQNWKKREAKRVNKKVQDSNGNIFRSAVEAAKYYGAKYSSNIHQCCQGLKKSAYGQGWKYLD